MSPILALEVCNGNKLAWNDDADEAYQQNGDDQAEETDGAAEDLDNENLDKERRVGRIRERSSRSNLECKRKILLVHLTNHLKC